MLWNINWVLSTIIESKAKSHHCLRKLNWIYVLFNGLFLLPFTCTSKIFRFLQNYCNIFEWIGTYALPLALWDRLQSWPERQHNGLFICKEVQRWGSDHYAASIFILINIMESSKRYIFALFIFPKLWFCGFICTSSLNLCKVYDIV